MVEGQMKECFFCRSEYRKIDNVGDITIRGDCCGLRYIVGEGAIEWYFNKQGRLDTVALDKLRKYVTENPGCILGLSEIENITGIPARS